MANRAEPHLACLFALCPVFSMSLPCLSISFQWDSQKGDTIALQSTHNAMCCLLCCYSPKQSREVPKGLMECLTRKISIHCYSLGLQSLSRDSCVTVWTSPLDAQRPWDLTNWKLKIIKAFHQWQLWNIQ